MGKILMLCMVFAASTAFAEPCRIVETANKVEVVCEGEASETEEQKRQMAVKNMEEAAKAAEYR